MSYDPIPDLAKLMAGAQVPMSLGALGKGADPLRELRRNLRLHGYPDAAETENALREAFRGLEQEPSALMCMERDLEHVMETCGLSEEGAIIQTTDTHVRFRMTRGMWVPA
jgi:hypothetical protein